MIGEPTTISRIVELIHLPIQHTAETLREIYAEISTSCGYDNFIRQQGGARLESLETESGSISRVTFMRDRIIFQEERTSSGLEHLVRRIEEALKVATVKAGIPLLIARTITQRAVASVANGETASNFQARTVFRFEEEDLATLNRPTQVVGFRLNFPARQPQEGSHRVRIETYLRDPASLFIEDVGTFKVPVQAQDQSRLKTELREVEEFLGSHLTAFLNRLSFTDNE